jgi:SAM-dependent methyltransferase
VRRLVYLPSDLFSASSRRKKMLPPTGLIYTGGGDFERMGQEIVGRLVSKHGLQAHYHVLDIGSGIGRVAVPLTAVLKQGKYCGFDVVKRGVDWCVKNISVAFPNFEFKYVPLHNDLYRSAGASPEVFTFPYPDHTFDFAIANSLFTHMMPAEVERYYEELNRVLKPGGKCYATFFTVPSTNHERFTSNSDFCFKVVRPHYRLMDENVTAANIAFEEPYLFSELIKPQHFDIEYRSYGYWSNESKQGTCEEFQDIIVAVKKK